MLSLDDTQFILFDMWPGVPRVPHIRPTDGYLRDKMHNHHDCAYVPGEKRQTYIRGEKGAPGYSTFIYLRANGEIQEQKTICVFTRGDTLYEVTESKKDGMLADNGMIAVSISPMADKRWGWFWCAGVCPVDEVKLLDGPYRASSGVTAGGLISVGDCGFIPVAKTAVGRAFAAPEER